MYSCSGPNTETCHLAEKSHLSTNLKSGSVKMEKYLNIFKYKFYVTSFSKWTKIRKGLTSPSISFFDVALHFHNNFSLWERH